MKAIATGPRPAASSQSNKSELRVPELSERRTAELVIAFVGPVYSGTSKTLSVCQAILSDKFKYRINMVKISDIIAKESDINKASYDDDKNKYFQKLQNAGNSMRQNLGAAYLAEKVVEEIAFYRDKNDGYKKKSVTESDGESSETIQADSIRVAHLIDSLKNPAEVKLLKDVYGDLFRLIGVFAPERIRKKRAEEKGLTEPEITEIFQRDEEENSRNELTNKNGQQVRKTIQVSDLFVRNDKDNTDKLRQALDRFFDILFGTKIHTPTFHEMAMFSAASAACQSACLSRQVGAAIYSAQEELLGVGRNDAPKYGGGLYTDDDGTEDHRCYKWKNNECQNDLHKRLLNEEIIKKTQEIVKQAYYDIVGLVTTELKTNGVKATFTPPSIPTYTSQVEEMLNNSKIRNLIEFSRAIHAEMEAIISVARKGKSGIVGSTLYCTTFPCHNCARHIVGAGIHKVVYIEPYPKSLARALHDDAIACEGEPTDDKVKFIQYEGIAPQNILKLFSITRNKENGKAHEIDPAEAKPIFPPPLDGFTYYEQLIVTKLDQQKKKNK